jgi:hypothetical protein
MNITTLLVSYLQSIMLTGWLAVVAAMPAISLAKVVVLEGVAMGVA